MTASSLDQVVNAVLYEGYMLYPYRPSSTKNRRERFTFGRVYPSAYSTAQHGAERCMIQTECLLHCPADRATLEVSVRFLQPTWREVGVCKSLFNGLSDGKEPEYRPVRELVVGGRLYQSWQEAVEREVKLAPILVGTAAPSAGPRSRIRDGQSPIPDGKWQLSAPISCADGKESAQPAITSTDGSSVSHPFAFSASRTFEALSEDATGRAVGVIVRRHEAVKGAVEVNTSPVGARSSKITVRIFNQTPVPETALGEQEPIMLRTFASTHTILRANGGEFISLTDPPDAFKALPRDCKNIGTWPVLVGDEERHQRDTMLSSPIILYDYPRIAPESNGDFFDGTEIDEMLALRVMTMTDAEKREMGGADALARKLLERTESFSPDHWMKMHGTMRDVKAVEEFFNPSKAAAAGIGIKPGDKVRLRPRNRADAFDLMLAGKTATVEAVEQDMENKVHLAVVLEDDPGKDLGLLRQPGHRFFYGLDEIEPLRGSTT